MSEWLEDDDDPCVSTERWPIAPAHLLPRERWLWWEQLWSDVIALAERYRISPAKDWWERGVQVEALAALAAWVAATTPANGMTRLGSSRCFTTSNGSGR